MQRWALQAGRFALDDAFLIRRRVSDTLHSARQEAEIDHAPPGSARRGPSVGHDVIRRGLGRGRIVAHESGREALMERLGDLVAATGTTRPSSGSPSPTQRGNSRCPPRGL